MSSAAASAQPKRQGDIPLVNLARQYQEIESDVKLAIEQVLKDQQFILGPHTKRFEEAFAKLLGVPQVIGCSNGTSAISLVLEASGVGAGDEVITVSHTFIATVEAIYRVGATPVFIDIDPATYNMNPALIEAAITPRTKAIIPVHIYGTPCDMQAIMAIADKHNLLVVEDTAQAHMAAFNGKPLGLWGKAATYSFYPGKNLGAYGDAGAIATGDEQLAQRVRQLRDHGRMAKYEHDMIGHNERMDAIQASILSVKLPHLTRWTENRRMLANHYRKRLDGFKIMQSPAGGESVYHLFVLEVSNREQVLDTLKQAGVHAGIHYPIPVHKQPAVTARLPKTLSLPATELAASRIMSLPICGSTTTDEVDYVCDVFLGVAKP
ncbi:MAG: DegT/DnrJ/EryC1/StrS family aminotransferase [Rickettsiales bacterium]|nr:DegT/DnrJ/EryC1/StrS family aminotransferase [Rickettsiales bacterium]